MSIRLKLGLEDDEFTDKTRIIIVKIEGATIGVIVDQVREVVTLDDDNTEKSQEPQEMMQHQVISAASERARVN